MSYLKAQGHRKEFTGRIRGEPELLMNLAWANLHRSTPELNAAEQYARSALTFVPY